MCTAVNLERAASSELEYDGCLCWEGPGKPGFACDGQACLSRHRRPECFRLRKLKKGFKYMVITCCDVFIIWVIVETQNFTSAICEGDTLLEFETTLERLNNSKKKGLEV